MKNLIVTIIASILSLSVFAQTNTERGEDFRRGTGERINRDSNENTISASDSARLKVKPIMKLWEWSHNGIYKKYLKRDTSIDREHSYNPVNNKSISNTKLSNLISPYVSNIFIERETNTDYQFLKVYDAYLTRPENSPLINTTTPYTEFVYKTGGSSTRGENQLVVTHTQNILPYWNTGIKYNLLTSEGMYMHNKSKIYDFSFFSNYEKDRFTSEFFINNNVGHFQENGGIDDPKYIRDTTMNTDNIPVKLMFAETDFYNVNIKSVSQYNIGSAKKILINKDTTIYYPIKFVYAFILEDNQRKFSEEQLKKDYFKNNFLSDNNTADKNGFVKTEHSIKLVWNEKYGSIKPGIYAGITSRNLKFSSMKEVLNENITKISTSIYSHNNFSTQYIEGGIFKQDSSRLNFDINVSLAVLGEYNKDLIAKANFDYKLNKNNIISTQIDYTNKAPDYNLNQFFSNHYKWNNSFNYQKSNRLKIAYINTNLDVEIGGAYESVDNYIYFNNEAMPTQHNNLISVYTGFLKHKLNLGRFHFVNNLFYQKSDNKVIELPEFSYKGSFFYKNYFFDKALLIEFGTDLTYNSKYYAPNYNVATNAYYLNTKEKFGDYPIIDLYTNFKIKRMNIFIKYEHLSYHFGNKNYFNNTYYPMDPAMLKYGLKWVFND